MLYPQENSIREVRSLDGFWDFQFDPEDVGETQGWPMALPAPEPMSVPASFNELTARPADRDYIGNFWYLRRFFVPSTWIGRRIRLRFGAVNYRAAVWLNGRLLMKREGGHLPFEADATALLRPGEENTVAIRVNNVLDWTCVPPGHLTAVPGTNLEESVQYFDFFNYAGIHRSVCLVATAAACISDIAIQTDLEQGMARIAYQLEIEGGQAARRVQILDRVGEVVTGADDCENRGEFVLDDFQLWSPEHPYLYRLRVDLVNGQGELTDRYDEEFGIRTVRVEGDRLLLNERPVYLRGCCRHDDFHLIGRGLNLPLVQKDLNLLKWLGANSFRTSHYPYTEEMMRLADHLGLLVIDECPAVGMNAGGVPVFTAERVNEQTLANHCRMLRELYRRDKNHPCVIAWSVANEPSSGEENALPYFEQVFAVMRELERTRPVTMITCTDVEAEKCCQLADFIGVNRYFGWYTERGRLDAARSRLRAELISWHEKYRKPVMLTEFGADTVAGLHSLPAQMFTEEYQVEFLRTYGEVLDGLDFVIGEHIWNLADFMTNQGVLRVMGNRKGVFTRERQPKMAAHFLRERWSGNA